MSESMSFPDHHPVLGCNEDYVSLLHALVSLEAQRSQAIRDVEALEMTKLVVMSSPENFVASLKDGTWNNKDIAMIRPQKLTEVPDIDFSRYETRRLTRSRDPVSWTRRDQSTGTTSSWSDAEHELFLSLLVVYPPEPVNFHRCVKISEAMGSRTPTQVASHLQKYCLKLAKQGLPVPGPMPNLATYMIPKPNRNDRKRALEPETTYSTPTVAMSMDDDISDDESVPLHLRNTAEYQELKRLMRLKRERAHEHVLPSEEVHIGFSCDACGVEPIRGTRLTCLSCKSESVDICGTCHTNGTPVKDHDSAHTFTAVIVEADEFQYLDDCR